MTALPFGNPLTRGTIVTDEIRVGVLASGRGSNFEALYSASQQNLLGARVVCFATDSEDCLALEKARTWDLPSICVSGGRKRGALPEKSVNNWTLSCVHKE